MSKFLISVLIFMFSLSICLNLFQRRNQAVACYNLDSYWKAEILYKLGHKHLDKNGNGIPCEVLHDYDE